MSYKRTLVFLAIFTVLAAFFYVYEIKDGEERRLAGEQEQRLFSFEAGQATRLTLHRPDESIVADKRDAGWRITAPVDAPADTAAVNSLLDALAGLKFERDIGAQNDLEPFGLSEPGLELEIEGRDKTLGHILVGAETPDGSKLYVKASDRDSVFAVNRSLKGSLDKSLFDLRDKKIVAFSADDVAAVEIARDGESFAFQKSDEGAWAITRPARYRADADKIGNLLDSIANARAKKFVEEEATDLEKYDLASPPIRLEFDLVNEAAALYFGARTAENGVFARRSGSGRVFELATNILDNVSSDIADWRDRTLLEFERDDVAKLRITAGAARTTVERSSEDAGAWKVTEPEPEEADAGEVGKVLYTLDSEKVIRFVPENEADAAARALAVPAARIELWTNQNEAPLALLIGEKEEKGEAYAVTEPDGEFSVVRAGLMEQLIPDPDNVQERFKDKSAITFRVADVETIDIATREKSYSIEREGVNWGLPNGLDMEEYEIDRLLWDLQELEYISIIPRDGDDALYGFDSPALKIAMSGAAIDGELKFTIGKRVPERESYYALGGDARIVMEIDGAFVTEWLGRF